MGIVEDLKKLGFEHWDTGGNCTALVKVLPTGQHFVVTDKGGLEYPTETDWWISLYTNEDWLPEGARKIGSQSSNWPLCRAAICKTLGVVWAN